jgi:CRISPR/Cas system-associated exonuclease Cas4 (RecB family)
MASQPRRFGLSKSKITAFEQCPKRLWLSVHRRHLAKQDESAAARFATGHEVGAVACALLPDGVMVEAAPDLAAALDFTRALLNNGHDRPVFEATLEHDGILVRIDVLEPDGAGGWHMAEVKSSTKAKDYHVGDLATQLWVARNAGLAITRAAIRHIDTSFILEREGDWAGLFADTDLAALVEPIIATRADVVAEARATLAGIEPNVEPGSHCATPFVCEFGGYCHASLPAGPEWPVTVLPNGGGKRWIERNIIDLFAIDPAELTSAMHKRVYQATVTGEVYHDVAGARSAIGAWAFPRTWLDFETIAFAVPRWVGTKPYGQVPFQFSAHIEAADGTIDHREFLSLDGTDPRRACADALIMTIPAAGAVIGYNASFEKSRILELAAAFPDLADALTCIASRVVDLLPVTRANWYHRDQRGSWSIKAVLPTVAAEMDYAGLEVKDGGSAQEAYIEAIAECCTPERRMALDAALRAYCGRDTEAMFVLARKLSGDL